MSAAQIDPVQLTQALIRCPSITPVDAGALDVLQGVLEPIGFSCHRLVFKEDGFDDVDNLFARIGTGAPQLCFAGHTDVVPVGEESAWTHPPFAADIVDGTLYGRGAVDMKGAIASFVSAAKGFLDSNGGMPAGSLSLLITGDEEGHGVNGTTKVLDWLAEQRMTPDHCLVGEPTCPQAVGDAIKVGRRGSVSGEIVVHGTQGHSAYPHLAENPIPKLARIIDRLSALNLDDGTENFDPSTLQITIISVPNAVTNVIPGEARAAFNIRNNDLHDRKSLVALVKSCVAAAAEEVSARYTIRFTGQGRAFLTKPGPLVEAMETAILDVTGNASERSTSGGTSDARFIKDHCPVIEFGLVNKTIHATDERTSVADIGTLSAIYQKFLETYFAGASQSS